MKFISLCICLLGISSLYGKEPAKEPTPPPYFKGFYFGVNIPYGVDYYHWKESGLWTGGSSTTKKTLSAAGFAPGGRLGYEYTFLSRIFTAIDLSGNYLYKKVKSTTHGNFEGNKYFEDDKLWRHGQFLFTGHLGVLLFDRAVLYFIGGGEYTKLHLKQSYRFTTITSEINQKNSKNLWGGVLGLGTGIALSDHFEMRLEVTKSYFWNASFPEVHQAGDSVKLDSRQLYGNLSFVYRI